MCVRRHSENSEPTMLISQTAPDGHPPTPPPCRWPALITSSSFSSFGAASEMLCGCALPACSSTPLRPSVHYPSISLVVNIMYIQTFCEHLDVLYMFSTRQTCIALKSGWSSTPRMPASSLGLLPCLQLPPIYFPSPSSSSFGAACVKLCCLPLRWSETSVCCLV